MANVLGNTCHCIQLRLLITDPGSKTLRNPAYKVAIARHSSSNRLTKKQTTNSKLINYIMLISPIFFTSFDTPPTANG